MKKIIALCFAFVICLTGCTKSSIQTEFSLSDFIENEMFQTKETIFSRYGWDLDHAVQSKEGNKDVYTSVETITMGNESVPLQFFFDGETCTMLKYRISLPEKDTVAAAYDVLISQSEWLRGQLASLCDFENIEEPYTKFPDDRFTSAEDLFAAMEGKEVYDYFWSWILNKYDETEKLWADLMLWLPENGIDAYVEFRVYYIDNSFIGS